jgi:UDP-N-acetylglucosamine 2-epimerase (non-hydrolysing)
MPDLLIAIGGPRSFVGAASLLRAAKRRGLASVLLETDAPYTDEVFRAFDELGFRGPDLWLRGDDGAAALRRIDPAIVAVVGTAESTLAFGLLAAGTGRPLARVDAGRRTESGATAQACDHAAAYLFTSAPEATGMLLAEGIAANRVHFVGSAMADTLPHICGAAATDRVREHLAVDTGPYAVVRVNRPENVDEYGTLAGLVEAVLLLSRTLPIVFVAHSRTRAQLQRYSLDDVLQSESGVHLRPAMSYVDFVRLCAGARLVVTDSGDVEEETTILGAPCLTVSNVSGHPVTLVAGTNRLVGKSAEEIVEGALTTLEAKQAPTRPDQWDGVTGGRIADALAAGLQRSPAAVATLA